MPGHQGVYARLRGLWPGMTKCLWLCLRSRRFLNRFLPTHISLQHIRDRDAAALLLIGLHHGDQRTADRNTRAVERMHKARRAAFRPAARIHAPRLEVAAVRAGGNLAVHALPRQPHLDVIGLLRREAHVAGAQRYDAIVQAKPSENFFGTGEHSLMLVFRLLRRRDRHQLHLVELMLADHAARVLAGRARFGTEAGRVGRDAPRQFGFVDDGFADEIGERDFGGGDEPASQLDKWTKSPHLPISNRRMIQKELFASFHEPLMENGRSWTFEINSYLTRISNLDLILVVVNYIVCLC